MLSKSITARALLLGQGIELRRLNQLLILSRDPTTIEVEGGGHAVLFRFGVAVLFDVPADAEKALLVKLHSVITEPLEPMDAEELRLRIVPDAEEQFLKDELILHLANIQRYQVVADILAKSVFLDHYDQRASVAFDRIEPLAERMQSGGRLPRQAKRLMCHIGEVLAIQHHLIGRALVGEKPDILWEHPELERLWQRLENEYEIGERQLALERKLEMLSGTAETLLGLLQDRRTLRVEWYIVILILVEIVLTLYELFFRHGN
ncbi:MAG: RMD1 family protein [Gammaproteobacteria bacterium]|jgi:required for meiotic nuclear division protein 1